MRPLSVIGVFQPIDQIPRGHRGPPGESFAQRSPDIGEAVKVFDVHQPSSKNVQSFRRAEPVLPSRLAGFVLSPPFRGSFDRCTRSSRPNVLNKFGVGRTIERFERLERSQGRLRPSRLEVACGNSSKLCEVMSRLKRRSIVPPNGTRSTIPLCGIRSIAPRSGARSNRLRR
jgi:hypothetical protein